jgi:myosin-crossreactive antigen
MNDTRLKAGSIDGEGTAEKEYTARGGREIEKHFECFMDLFGSVPSLTNPDRTVLNEFRELNLEEPIVSHCRIVSNQGKKGEFSSLGLSTENVLELACLYMLSEEKQGSTTIEQYFWFFWAYTFNLDVEGDYIKKTMSDCTGREMFEELLYHRGLKDKIPQIQTHTVNVIPSMMPYNTSQFMPRVAGDRPEVIPAESTNFAFVGQFAEVPQDCVFTVGYSVRSAMMAVYGLLNLEKSVKPVYSCQYDVRVPASAAKTCLTQNNVPLKDIPPGKLPAGTELAKML